MPAHKALDPRARPPAIIQDTYKSLQKRKAPDAVCEAIDLDNGAVNRVGAISTSVIVQACLAIEDKRTVEQSEEELSGLVTDVPIFEHDRVPGLLIVPALLPARAQKTLLSRLLHRDLSNSEHLTNVHFHHRLPYQDGQSFFSLPRGGPAVEPLDPATHKNIPFEAFMTKKLRWATLGGQYDWSAKVYPSGPAPTFPPDIAKFLQLLFPQMKAEAAILNIYSPGDVLSMHRDVAEESDKGLISISIGCDAVFLIGLGSEAGVGGDQRPLALRLKSGDAVFMGGRSRFAWHGVPRIIPDTCPEFLQEWPADGQSEQNNEFEHWRGWMKHKRINLNVRQMWD